MKSTIKRRILFLCVVLLMAFLPANTLAYESVKSENDQMNINTLSEIPDIDRNGDVNQQVVIIYNQSSAMNVQSLFLTTNEVVSGEAVSDRVDVLEIKNDVNIDEFISKVNENPHVLVADRNRIIHTYSLPNDPYVIDGKAWQFQNIGADKTWDQVSNSETIGVAVLDTGLNTSHPDLADRIIAGYDYVTKSSDVIDQDGHGTLVSGFIAATANNGNGISGVAGSANIKIAPYRVGVDGLSVSNICAALMNAADRPDIKVINMSYGGYEYNNSEAAAIQYAKDRGKILVAASGNEGEPAKPEAGSLSYPASYDGVISVAATTNLNNRAAFSQYNKMVDLAAPGTNVYTTTVAGGYTEESGTSFSSPIVAGACGVLLASNTSLNATEVENILEQTALDLGSSGQDDYYGYGLIQLDQALAAAAIVKPSTISVGYQTHIQNIGWQDWKYDGAFSGSEGMGYRLEAIKMKVDSPSYDVGIAYKTHIQNIGWEPDWRYNEALSGTSGEGLRLEAIQIQLTGADADKFDLYYRTHVENFGWLGWAQDSENSGSAGFGYRLEGIEIMVLEKGIPFDTSGDAYITNNVI